ncbi:MAG: hypothetical protein FWE45_04090 [Firmicutes bacterium]|nr:hypothetical protein [Bacillota bacterium]
MNILIATANNKSRNSVGMLARALSKKHKVTVASMSSDSGHRAQAFSFVNAPTRVNKITTVSAPAKKSAKNKEETSLVANMDGIAIYEFYSNPADAMSIMLGEIMLNRPPDLVICGISNGTNLGPDIYSSSHVGMAMEAVYFGKKAIVVATEFEMGDNSPETLKPVIQFVEKNIEKFAKLDLGPQTFLNMNLPKVDDYKDFKGVKFTQMGKTNTKYIFEPGVDPKGGKYFWARRAEREASGDDDDMGAYNAGYISVTPISYDSTEFDMIDGLGKALKKLGKA